MSKFSEKSPTHCAEKQALAFHNFNKQLLFYLLVFFLTILVVLLLYLTLRPSKPQFSLRQDNLDSNLTTPSLLNSSIHLTLLSHNPNNRVGIYYEEFLLHASYKGQNVTPDASIAPFYQGHHETNPVSAVLAYQVQHKHKARNMTLSFGARGKLRWKVGTWVSTKYKFSVDCASVATFGTMQRNTAECRTSM